MITIVEKPRLSAADMTRLFRRACDHLGIAFSANYVFPGLADIGGGETSASELRQLNSIGANFGIRFRQMTGSLRDLINTVSCSGPALVLPSDTRGDHGQAILVLETRHRNRVLIHTDIRDQVVSSRWMKKHFELNADGQYQWLLIQPILAAEEASRFNYQTGLENEPVKPLRRLLRFLKPETKDIRTILIFSVVIGLLSLTTPLAVEAIVNTIAFGRYLQPLIVLSFIVAVFLGFRAGLSVLMTMVAEVIQRKLFVRTVEDLSYRLTRVPLEVWKKYHGPELVNRFFDIVNVQKISSKLLLDTLMLLLQTVIGLTVLAFYHPFLLGYGIGLLTMMTFVLWFMGRGAVQTAIQESQLKYDSAAWLQEIVRHPLTFKFNGGLSYAINRADELAARYINERQSHFKILIRQISFAMFMQVVAATVLLALGGFLVIDQQMTLGQLVAAELIVTVILGSFAKIGKDLESFYDLLASVDKLGKLFDLPIADVNKLQLVRRPGPLNLSIEDFQLDSTQTTPARIKFDAGETYAICGSTELRRNLFVEALSGQRKPKNGYVMLDEFRVDSVSVESLQENIGLVRGIELFDGTVDENLRLGRPNIGSSRVNDIVQKLGLQQTVARLESGFATKMAVSGYPLSQGQAIRLVLARALISHPGILLIDGLLDRLSDDDTDDVLERLRQFRGETTILIATGRGAITRWSGRKLDISRAEWRLENSAG